MELEKPIPPRGGIIIQLNTVHSVKTTERVDLPAAYAECLPYKRFVSEELQHVLTKMTPETKRKWSNEEKIEGALKIVAAYASFAGYVGLFTIMKCNNFDLLSNWWAIAFAVASFITIAMIPFIYIEKTWPDKILERWFASIVLTVFLIWAARLAARYFPGAC